MVESEKIRCSAPGKLFFLGEYGVLAGGWTLVAAVNRRVYARFDPEGRGYRAVGAGARTSLKLPRAVVASLPGSGPSLVTGEPGLIACFETDVRSFFEGRQKLGLGSSAASVVALSAAALRSAGADTSVDTVFETAFVAHRRLQNGRGSGADVAASTYGGLLAYRLETATPPFEVLGEPVVFEGEKKLAGVRILPGLVWPEGLEFRAIWTGNSASSTGLIARIEASFGKGTGEVDDLFAEINQTATAAVGALLEHRAQDLMELFARGDALMERLAACTGAAIITEQHRAIRRLGERYGVIAKPSGAGGGDFSLLIGPSSTPWERLERELPAGCQMVGLQLDAQGVR